MLISGLLILTGCSESELPVATSGVRKAEVKVETDLEETTVDQQNVRARLLNNNKIGAIKHLYIISPYSGIILLYSTVKGKVTCSGKGLTPVTVDDTRLGFPVMFDNREYNTQEVLQDDGTYGSSDPYIFR